MPAIGEPTTRAELIQHILLEYSDQLDARVQETIESINEVRGGDTEVDLFRRKTRSKRLALLEDDLDKVVTLLQDKSLWDMLVANDQPLA